MQESTKGWLLGIVCFIFLLAVYVLGEGATCSSADIVSGPKLEIPPPVIKPVIQTETLYCLDVNANVRGGPGKSYKVIDKIYFNDEVVVEKELYGPKKDWRKIDYGYVHSSLVGTAEQIIKKYCDTVKADVKKLQNAGVIKRIKGYNIYVDRRLWQQYSVTAQQNFSDNFALIYQFENRIKKCVIIDDETGDKIPGHLDSILGN
jgi:hypothetical protein